LAKKTFVGAPSLSPIQAFALARNIQWLDLNPGLTNDAQGLLPKYTWDGLHLSKPAYLYWAERLRNFIQ
jgi:lysophospholipase L1-like esterase